MAMLHLDNKAAIPESFWGAALLAICCCQLHGPFGVCSSSTRRTLRHTASWQLQSDLLQSFLLMLLLLLLLLWQQLHTDASSLSELVVCKLDVAFCQCIYGVISSLQELVQNQCSDRGLT